MIKKFTRKRQIVLDKILDYDKPITAEELMRLIDEGFNLSTVYRALEFLEEKGLIKSISFDGNLRYFFSSEGHHHFLYCERCHSIQTFNECAAERLQKKVEEEFDYEIKDHVFYFTGICEACRNED